MLGGPRGIFEKSQKVSQYRKREECRSAVVGILSEPEMGRRRGIIKGGIAVLEN